MPTKAPNLIPNYINNAQDILDYAQDNGNFVRREKGRKNFHQAKEDGPISCLLYTSPSPRDRTRSRMPSSA